MGSLPPEPVLDHQTKQQKTGANGEPLCSMELMCFSGSGMSCGPPTGGEEFYALMCAICSSLLGGRALRICDSPSDELRQVDGFEFEGRALAIAEPELQEPALELRRGHGEVGAGLDRAGRGVR